MKGHIRQRGKRSRELKFDAGRAATGKRLGEVLVLSWRNADIDAAKVIRVREALEETKANGISFKPPKTKAGRRDITLPDVVVEVLRDHRRRQAARWRARVSHDRG